MSGRALRTSEWLIACACCRLPEDQRDDRFREWTAELPHILHDPETRFAPVRVWKTLAFAAGHYRGAGSLRGGKARRKAWIECVNRAVIVSSVVGGVDIVLAAVGIASNLVYLAFSGWGEAPTTAILNSVFGVVLSTSLVCSPRFRSRNLRRRKSPDGGRSR